MFNYLKDLLGAEPPPAAAGGQPAAKRPGGGRWAAPTEVREVDWAEWESSVFNSELDALLSGPAPLAPASARADGTDRSPPPALPEVREVDWSVWEASMPGGLGRKRKR